MIEQRILIFIDQIVHSQFTEKPFLSNSRKEKDNHELLKRINYSAERDLKVKLQEVILFILFILT